MKKRFFIGFALLSFFLTSCQKTPDEAVVAEKTQPSESRVAENIPTGQQTEIKINTSLYEARFTGAEEDVNVVINAETRVPEEAFPVLYGEPHTVTVEDVKQWVDYFFQTDDVYEPKRELTKGEIEESILELKASISDTAALEEYYEGDRVMMENYVQMVENKILQFEKMYDSAPEEYTPKKTDWAFHPLSYYDWKFSIIEEEDFDQELRDYYDMDTLMIEGNIGENTGMIIAYVSQNSDVRINNIKFILTENENGAPEEIVHFSDHEMKLMINELTDNLNMPKMQTLSIRAYGKRDQATGYRGFVNENAYEYRILLQPVYDGVPLMYPGPIYDSNLETYDSFYEYEQLEVWIRDSGIVYVDWNAPLDIVSKEQDPREIFDFEEAFSCFEKQMKNQLTIGFLSRVSPDDSYYNEIKGSISQAEVRISLIELGYVRIKIPNNENQYQIVPAWFFRGEEALDFGNGYSWQSENDYYQMVDLNVYEILNGLDGSIINTELGY